MFLLGIQPIRHINSFTFMFARWIEHNNGHIFHGKSLGHAQWDRKYVGRWIEQPEQHCGQILKSLSHLNKQDQETTI